MCEKYTHIEVLILIVGSLSHHELQRRRLPLTSFSLHLLLALSRRIMPFISKHLVCVLPVVKLASIPVLKDVTWHELRISNLALLQSQDRIKRSIYQRMSHQLHLDLFVVFSNGINKDTGFANPLLGYGICSSR